MQYARDDAEVRRLERERRESPPPPHPMLALQRSAGNRAVAALLARSPDAAAPADEKAASGPSATLPEIGTIPLLSIGFAPGGTRRKAEAAPKEITLTSKLGPHSPRLSKAALDGRPMDVEIVMAGGNRLTLKEALVTAYSTSGQGEDAIESWTLDFGAMEQPGGGG